MRKVLALMMLMCGAASADAAAQPQETWCSDGFDRPAELVISAGPNFVLKIAGSPDETLDKADETIYPPSYATLQMTLHRRNTEFGLSATAYSGPARSKMAIFKDTIMVKDRPYDRAVQVTVIAPDDMNVLNVQELAERAWRAPGTSITVGKVTVKVRAFKR